MRVQNTPHLQKTEYRGAVGVTAPPIGSLSDDAAGRMEAPRSGAPPPPPVLDSLATSSRESYETRKNKLRRMRRGVISSAAIHQDELQDGGHRYRAALLTFTYADVDAWEPNHIAALQHHVRDWGARRGVKIRGVWVLEVQKRGAPHYHCLFFLPRGLTLPKPDKQGWWKHGFTNCKWVQRPVGYMAKYASKDESKTAGLPKGARLWGVVGLGGHGRNVLRWWLAPQWLRGMSTAGDVLRKVGGWWENRTIGIAYRSPWVLDTFAGGTANFIWLGWTEDDVRFLR